MNHIRVCRQAQSILNHERKLRKIFKVHKALVPGELFSKLQRLENRAQAIALQLCNGPEFAGGYEEVDDLCEKILDKIDSLLNFRKVGIDVRINRDPRGYSLKIYEQQVRTSKLDITTDWGGYGILCPEIN